MRFFPRPLMTTLMATLKAPLMMAALLIAPALFITALSITALSSAALAQEGAPPTPESDAAAAPLDLLIHGGPIHTGLDGSSPQSVGVRDGRIVHVGPLADGRTLAGPDTTTLDLKGAALFPGFTDAHAHLKGIGERERTLTLANAGSLDSLLDRLKQYHAAHGDKPVITGRGWLETHWPEGRMPSRFDLDRAVADTPVLLTRADGHAMVVNTAALDAAGIDRTTGDPRGGTIVRNRLGEATGLLIDSAMGLMDPLLPEETPDTLKRDLGTGAELYARRGWTGIHNMSVSMAGVAAMEALDDAGALPIRVHNAVDRQFAETLFDTGARRSESGRVVTRAVKLYMDGALGSRGAALLSPYADGDTSGLMLSEPGATKALMRRARDEGIQLAIHAIGDRANRVALDWVSDVLGQNPAMGHRWRIEHAQIIHGDDLPRFSRLGLIPSMQPSHAIGDLHFAPDRLGRDRLDRAYRWADLLASGTIIAGGSDAPVEKGSPLIEFYAAITREDTDGFQGEGWHPEQAVTRQQALKMFTLWPARAAFADDRRGTIETGKQADLTAFSKDLMTAPPADILDAEAVLTVVDGRIVHSMLE
ncbi:amidohydrolase [Yunchengibacter salinarum]|uniref:amidohydrolase n=1 Tax=Yunchengibacter salinarum TaxID=3133399 RepID=UPI0035B585D7